MMKMNEIFENDRVVRYLYHKTEKYVFPSNKGMYELISLRSTPTAGMTEFPTLVTAEVMEKAKKERVGSNRFGAITSFIYLLREKHHAAGVFSVSDNPGMKVVYYYRTRKWYNTRRLSFWVFNGPTPIFYGSMEDGKTGKFISMSKFIAEDSVKEFGESIKDSILDFFYARLFLDVEIQYTGRKSKSITKKEMDNERHHSPGEIKTTLLTKAWYVEIDNNTPFGVRGHYRHLANGETIWRAAFDKNGYHRKAGITKLRDGEIKI